MAVQKKLLDENSLKAIKTYVDGLVSTRVAKNNDIDGATKCKITYDGKGLVTNGQDLSASDIPNLDATSKLTSGSATASQYLEANGSGGVRWTTVTVPVNDVQVNGTSVVSSRIANIVTNTAYNASNNKIATMSDLPAVGNGVLTINVNGSYKGGFLANQDTDTTINITASDLGLASALRFLGTTTTALTDGSTTNPIKINGSDVTAVGGNVVLYNSQEFLWNDSIQTPTWELLGDESSYALKTISITGEDALLGGGDLSQSRSIKHSKLNASGAKSTSAVYKLTLDIYGHVLSATTASASDVGALPDSTVIPTGFSITANATDGILDITGTGGTNSVTYAVAPYNSTTATSSWVSESLNNGKLYYGDIDPVRTQRLNYNGHFHATKLTGKVQASELSVPYTHSGSTTTNNLLVAGTDVITLGTPSSGATFKLRNAGYIYNMPSGTGGTLAALADLLNIADNATYCLTEAEALAILQGA